MQNKGAITLLTIALALVSLYQLSFTWKTNRVEKVAREYAQGDPVKEKVYLDSIANKEVYNFLGIAQYTYKECKELELNLGLDLRGGMNVTMEVDVVDVVRSLANYSQDEAFNQALQEAVKMRTSSPKDFVTLFGEAFERIAPNAQLASPNIFGTVELKDKIKIGASNKEVLDVIRQEAEGAIDNTFHILRTRIDRFGVAQPNIRKADISGRIVIELPGIKDAQRVRKLLQGTAALEFYETFDNGDFFPYLQAANEKARTIVEAEEILTTENAANATAEQPETTKADTTANSRPALQTSRTGNRLPQIVLYLFENIYQRRRERNSVHHRKAKSVILPRLVIGILPQNDYLYLFKRTSIVSMKNPTSRRENRITRIFLFHKSH